MPAIAALAVFAILTSASQGGAQELAGTFDQLRVLVKTGDRIRVIDTAGQDIRGTIADIGSSSLAIVSDGTRRDLAERDIATIHQRRSDSLANGALWGFATGAGLGLFGGIALSSTSENSGVIVPIFALLYGGIGAGIGTGLDAMFSAERVIYARRTTSARLRPIVSYRKRTIGLSVSLSR